MDLFPCFFWLGIDKGAGFSYLAPSAQGNRFGRVAEWLMAADCKSARASVRRFESYPFHHKHKGWPCGPPLVFMVEMSGFRTIKGSTKCEINEHLARDAAKLREAECQKREESNVFAILPFPSSYARQRGGRSPEAPQVRRETAGHRTDMLLVAGPFLETICAVGTSVR